MSNRVWVFLTLGFLLAAIFIGKDVKRHSGTSVLKSIKEDSGISSPAKTDSDLQNKVLAPNTTPIFRSKPAVSISELMAKYKTQFNIDYTKDRLAATLYGNVDASNLDGDPWSTTTLKNFLFSASEVLNINVDQLDSGNTVKKVLGNVTSFAQFYEFGGKIIPVEGGMIRVHQDSKGGIFLVNNTFVPGVDKIDPNPTVSQSVAEGIALRDAEQFEQNPGNTDTPKVMETKLVIYQLKKFNKVELCYKISVHGDSKGGAHDEGIYFVNAHNSDQFERREGVIF